MRHTLDLDSYPLDRLKSRCGRAFLESCRQALENEGMVDLPGFLRAGALAQCMAQVGPLFPSAAFRHKRRHNIYFDDRIPGLSPDHPALRQIETANYTICGDQIPGSVLSRVYEWPPLAAFLAAALDKTRLFLMDDPLARINVMAYPAGEGLNWHFDRSEFTVTLLLQAPAAGGLFQYRTGLRTDDDPNYRGVARLLDGRDDAVQTRPLTAGTLSLFKGRNTAHRVTPVEGDRYRIVAVFSFYEKPGVRFSAAERRGFYGRTSVEESLA